MITAAQIMAGALPRTKKTFNVTGIGEIELHRLPLNREIEAQKLIAADDVDIDKLEKLILNNTYFMLFGEYNDEESQKLYELLDQTQITNLHATGLFFTQLDADTLEQTEKNSRSDQS